MLSETQIGGVKTNLTFLRRVLAHPEFVAVELDTGFIPRHQDQLLPPVGALTPQFWQVAGEAFAQSEPIRSAVNDPSSPRAELDGWRAGTAPETTWVLTCQGQIKKVSVNVWPRWHGEWIFCIDGKSDDPGASEDADRPPSATALRRHHAIRRGNSLYLEWQGELLTVTAVDPIADEASHIHSAGLTAPMNGSIVRMLVAVGQEVVTGAALVVLNTMKMKRSIRAPRDGVIKALYCREGERVNDGATLVELEGIE
ncbi:Biotin carrier protein MADF [compost metagenome]